MRHNALFALILIPYVCVAQETAPENLHEISVGGVTLQIPDPEGFSLITPQMTPLYELQKQFVAPSNEEFAVFIPSELVAVAQAGQVPRLPRRCTVQTGRDLATRTLSSADFARLKTLMKQQYEQLVQKLMAEAPDLMKQVREGVNRELKTDLAFSVSQMIPFPFHEESDRSLVNTALVKYEIQDDTGAVVPFVTSVTSAFVHVKGKVLFLYTYAEEDAVAWSQQASRDWVARVIQANPGDPPAQGGLPALGIDWNRVRNQAILGGAVGAIVGGVIGLIRLVNRRRPE